MFSYAQIFLQRYTNDLSYHLGVLLCLGTHYMITACRVPLFCYCQKLLKSSCLFLNLDWFLDRAKMFKPPTFCLNKKIFVFCSKAFSPLPSIWLRFRSVKRVKFSNRHYTCHIMQENAIGRKKPIVFCSFIVLQRICFSNKHFSRRPMPISLPL